MPEKKGSTAGIFFGGAFVTGLVIVFAHRSAGPADPLFQRPALVEHFTYHALFLLPLVTSLLVAAKSGKTGYLTIAGVWLLCVLCSILAYAGIFIVSVLL